MCFLLRHTLMLSVSSPVAYRLMLNMTLAPQFLMVVSLEHLVLSTHALYLAMLIYSHSVCLSFQEHMPILENMFYCLFMHVIRITHSKTLAGCSCIHSYTSITQ